jgi:hypothetical protein
MYIICKQYNVLAVALQVQLLRSVGIWSIGYDNPECSILNAWVDAIVNAEHFIYIENQVLNTYVNFCVF